MSVNYKDTLNLPKTEFPMKADLPKREPSFLERWNQTKIYDQLLSARKHSPKFILHDGPPFANGDAHMGHALNMTLKDIVLKSKNMSGFYSPFVPGWDCHGLPIEFKVTKDLGNKARTMSVAEIRGACDTYARKYINLQREQFKRLGVFGEWDNPYLTIDPRYEAEVIRTFADLVEKDMVYASQKPVLWSTGAQTALAEAEVEYLDHQTPAIYVKFPTPNAAEALGLEQLRNLSVSLMIWTTTPWTLPANLAIAARSDIDYAVLSNGKDAIIVAKALAEKIAALEPSQAYTQIALVEGKSLEKIGKAKHPFLEGRESTILFGDHFVTTETGTGLVHIAPGHGKDDYDVGKHLGVISPVNDYGKFTDEVGIDWLVGKYVFDANREIVDKLLIPTGALYHEALFKHTYPHCWRSKTPIVFRAVEQWFIRIDGSGLKEKALSEIKKVKWVPDWGQNRISGAVESRGDWCISRQRTWGVPLPAFYDAEGKGVLNADAIRKLADLVEKEGTNVWFASEPAQLARTLGLPDADNLTKKNDTIDVWIDSGSSQRAVEKTHPEIKFPVDMYLEGSDQHRGWFQSSLLLSVATLGRAPYKEVLTNGFVVDLDGKKLSKSGTGYQKPIDMMSMINLYGADILRLWVASENYQNDVPWSEEIFKHVSGSYRTIRNTLRILHANLYDFNEAQDSLSLSPAQIAPETAAFVELDRYILSKLQALIGECRKAYDEYEFHKVYHLVNSFCTIELSSLYVDISKDRMYCDIPHSARRRATQTVMLEVLKAITLLIAPIMPYTSEEMWGYISNTAESVSPENISRESVHLQLFPEARQDLIDTNLEEKFALRLKIREKISAELEKLRAAKTIGKAIDAWVEYKPSDDAERNLLAGKEDAFAEFIIVSDFKLLPADAAETVKVTPASQVAQKCARSWKYDRSVGTNLKYPDLTSRDVEAVEYFSSRVAPTA